ncbi:MAG: hypothetical protein Q9218_000722 [Villophora microphyllina]
MVLETASQQTNKLFDELNQYLVYLAAAAVYNTTLHPLARFPGPKLRGAFYFPQYWDIYIGDTHHKIKGLHDAYGDTVRISPSTLSYTNSQAWKGRERYLAYPTSAILALIHVIDIYGNRQGKHVIPKDKEFYHGLVAEAPNIIISYGADHARIRRLLSHAFSEVALREQEQLITYYLDVLVEKLYQQMAGRAQGKINIVEWYNFTSFDILSDLCFAESFNALKEERYHPWVATIFRSLKLDQRFRVLRAYPVLGKVILGLLPLLPQVAKAEAEHRALTAHETEQRLNRQTDRKDFMSYILRHNDQKGMTRDEIKGTTGALIIAGSETTATLLSGATFFLLKNPACLLKAVDEVRNAFAHTSDITFASVAAQLPYLDACLDESLRLYPPVPSTLPRRTGPEGAIINGDLVPPNVSVGVHPWSASLSATNFKDPYSFVPERWLGEEHYANDNRAASRPFLLGPRNLAYAEMRSILARVLWHFDLELCEESRDWAKQKVFALWDKPALNVRLRSRGTKV